MKHIDKEIKNNAERNTNNTFWQNRYKHITDNKYTFCKAEPETVDYFITCKHEFVESTYFEASLYFFIHHRTETVE